MTPQLLGPDGKPLFGDPVPAPLPVFYYEEETESGWWRVMKREGRQSSVIYDFLPRGGIAARLAYKFNREDSVA